jgi:ketosteroid isomerase-like protein
MRELMTEDFELSVSPSVRWGGAIGRDNAMARIERIFSSGRYYEPGTFACKVIDVLADGDKTVTHVIMTGRFPNGNPYENVYLVLMNWRDGKMSYQLELFDAAHWADQHRT